MYILLHIYVGQQVVKDVFFISDRDRRKNHISGQVDETLYILVGFIFEDSWEKHLNKAIFG